MDHGESLLFPQVFPKVPTSSSRPVRQPYPGLCVFYSSLLLERQSNPPIPEGTFGPLSWPALFLKATQAPKVANHAPIVPRSSHWRGYHRRHSRPRRRPSLALPCCLSGAGSPAPHLNS
ncbi:hypothetical protein CCUS01_09454 [Colletotrichum cuscutae]|uniref:Uncharacterized protein n=1 Tax=Colletotrichum cuscutae TaxID=1209917 RepID=A0AAI9XPD8_9PEZI|nr:hypothetical protein CCUS01_09454 [Colletotrichum cuscutae]